MANAITRDGITYRVAKTYTLDDSGEMIELEGGEMTESLIDSILAAEAEEAEFEQYMSDLEKEEQECHKKQPKTKNCKNLLI